MSPKRAARPARPRPKAKARPQRQRRLPASRRRAKKAPALSGEARAIPHTELVAKRDQLASAFAELQWDLGGMAYEMAGRDHFRLDLLVRQAAKLQQVDSELGQAERMLTLAREGASGTCPACGGLQARGAVYCWQCGKEQIAAPSGSMASSANPAVAPEAGASDTVSAAEQPTIIQSQATIPGGE